MKSHKAFIIGIVFVALLGFALPTQTIHADATDQTGSSTPTTDTTSSTTPSYDNTGSTTPPVVTAPIDETDATSTATSSAAITDDSGSMATTTATSTDPTATSTPSTDDSDDMSSSTPSTSTTTQSVSINLDIEGSNGTLFSGPLTVTACAPTASSTPAVSAYCAIQQSGLTSNWQYFSFGAALVNVNGDGDWNNGPWWTLFSNGQALSGSADNHILTSGETFLATDGPLPLQISVASSSPAVGSTTAVTVEGFNSWNYDYEPLAGATIVGADASSTDANGQTIITATSSTPFSVSATATGYLPSSSVTISPIAPADTSSNGFGRGGGGAPSGNTPSASSAFSFLTSQQNADGSFSSDVYTDWAALALALPDAPSSARSKMLTYLKNENPTLSAATDYERHAMALMALGINPYSGASTNYISPIVSQLTAGSAPINGDIFGLIALANAGYTSSDSVIQQTVASVLSQQAGNGSWFGGDIDLTAAAIQALSQFNSISGVQGGIANAELYLHSHQQNDGGFGDSDSTSWVLNAIAARGESPSGWTMNGSTPLSYLATQQQPDGGMTTASDSGLRTWSTAYALTAMEGRSWPSLMSNFSKPAAATTGGGATTATTTTDILVSTTTPIIATSTPVVIALPIISSTTTATTTHVLHALIAVNKTNVVATSSTPSNPMVAHTLTASVANAAGTHPFMQFITSIFSWIGSFFSHLF